MKEWAKISIVSQPKLNFIHLLLKGISMRSFVHIDDLNEYMMNFYPRRVNQPAPIRSCFAKRVKLRSFIVEVGNFLKNEICKAKKSINCFQSFRLWYCKHKGPTSNYNGSLCNSDGDTRMKEPQPCAISRILYILALD